MEGILHNIAAFNHWNDDERNVNVNRNENDWNDNWWFAGSQFSFSLPLFSGRVLFCELSVPTTEHLAGLV